MTITRGAIVATSDKVWVGDNMDEARGALLTIERALGKANVTTDAETLAAVRGAMQSLFRASQVIGRRASKRSD